MKKIFKKLTAKQAVITRIVFVALFFTMTTAVPVHRAEANIFDDIGEAIHHIAEALSHAFCGSGSGGDDYGMDTQTHASGFDSFQMASNLGNSAADFAFDQTGIRYDVNVGNDGHGGYQYTLTEPDSGGGGRGYIPHPTPTGTIYGDINFWGHGYAGRDRLCPGDTVPPEQNCNASCIALTGWACDTRPHTDIVTIGIYVNNELYDTLQPTFADSTVNTHCGSNPDNPTNNFRYPTPLAWKDGVPRTVTIKATRPSDNLSVNLVHAPWHGPTSFQVTCPVPLLPTIDLTGSLGTVAVQIKDVPFAVDTVIKNQGTLAAGAPIPVKLQFDRIQDGSSINKTVDGTVRALGINDQVDYTFPDISLPQIGEWRVRLVVDPQGVVEPLSSAYQVNNKTSWVSFFVDNPPSTAPGLFFWGNPPSVNKGPTATTTLKWYGRRLEPTCTASGAGEEYGWTGIKPNGIPNSSHQTVQVGNVAGNKTYRLTCTGTDGTRISRTTSVNVTDTTSTSGITIKFWATQNIIRSGESAKINWDINVPAGYIASCESTGPDGSGTPVNVTGRNFANNVPTSILTNTQVFTITCTPNSPDIETVSKSVTVEVIPVAREV